jgi:hypothetical protein
MNNEPDYDNLYFERKPMTQKIFDTDDAEDMALLWSILPDDAYSIKKSMGCQTWRRKGDDAGYYFEFVKINWHNKTEITRPIQEATEDDIGKICCFWNEDTDYCVFGFLTKITPHITEANKSKYQYMNKNYYNHCRRFTKQEIEELC